jgi:hypothetical protein
MLDITLWYAIISMGEIPPLRKLWNERLTSTWPDHR